MFKEFQGYNEAKRKKLKTQGLDKLQCQSNAEALFSLLCRPAFKSSDSWKTFKSEIEELGKCLSSYAVYLENQQKSQELRQSQLKPTRTVMEDISVSSFKGSAFIKDKYKLFDAVVSKADYLQAVLFVEEEHLDKPFENYTQKFRFFENIQLSCSIDLFCYCPGGGVSSIFLQPK